MEQATNEEQSIKQNVEEKLLTIILFGKVTIVKSLLASQLV